MSDPRRDDELLHDALDLKPPEREAFLRDACGQDEARLKNLLSLADAHDRASGFLDTPFDAADDDWIGQRIGAFELIELRGRGGSGRVYEARRATGDFEQRVAIKLMQQSLDADEDVRRFRVEAEALARLEHPHIARLIDAGIADGRQPYLILELVDGEDILEYCDTQQIGIEERLRIFQSVCGAVEYAHHNLVVHRDLKPGNIFVTADGHPKLLDFGIAKLLSAESIADSTVTLTRHVRLTPRYASPEQLAGEEISTLSDVYSLGVVLYELITGRPPYKLEGSGSREWEASVQSTTILHPSQAVDDEAAEPRGASLASLRRTLQGDLDKLLLKALHRDPDERYASPSALADDIGRFLGGLPVRARPDTVRYRFSKFAARNRFAVSAAAVAVLVLIAATVTSTVSLVKVRDAQRETEAQRRTAERTVDFLQGTIASIDPKENQSSEQVTVLEMLEDAEPRIEAELADEPLVAAQLYQTLGEGYLQLASMEKAERSLRRAVDLQERELGPSDPGTLTARTKLGKFYIDNGDFEAAKAQMDEVLERGVGDEIRVRALGFQSDILALQNNHEGALERGQEALAIARRLGDDEQLAQTLNMVGLSYTRLGKPAASIEAFEEALPLVKRLRGDDHSETAQVLNNLGFALISAGRESDAMPHVREALAILERVYGEDHVKVAVSRSHLGNMLSQAGEFDEATALHQKVIDAFRSSLGDDHVNVGHGVNNLGTAYMLGEDYARAIPRFADAARVYRLNLGDDHPYVATALHNMARSQRRAGDLEAAGETGDEAWRIRSRALPEDHPDIARSSEFMGRLWMDRGEPGQAESWFRRSARIRRETYEDDNIMRIDAERELGLCLQALGRYAEAETLLIQARDLMVKHLGTEDERTVRCEEQLAALRQESAAVGGG